MEPSRSAAAPTAALLVALAAAPLASETALSGSVVDARTGYGLLGVEVTLHAWDPARGVPAEGEAFEPLESRSTWSQLDGSFAIEGVPAGPVTLAFYDPSTELALGRLDGEHPAQSPWRLQAETGPTVLLGIEGADVALADWRARLVEHGPDGERLVWPWRALREGPSPWLRYPFLDHEPDDDRTVWIEVSERGLARGGRAELRSIDAAVLTAATVEARALGALLGRVTSSARSALGGASLALFPSGDPAVRADPERWRETVADEDGRFRFEGFEPGEHQLLVRLERGWSERRELRLEAGQRDLGDLALAAPPPAGAIDGLVLDGAEDLVAPALVRLAPLDPGAPARVLLLGLAPGPFDEGRPFRFGDVPSGAYRLSILSLDGVQWTPAERTVSPPAERLAFRRDATGELARFAFRVRDARTGKPLPQALFQVSSSDLWVPEARPIAAQGPSFAIAAGGSADWILSCEGYRPARGVVHASTGRRTTEFLDVALEPGFGARLLLRDATGLHDHRDWSAYLLSRHERAPLEGARVLAGGELLATSAAEGAVALELEEAPRRLSIELEGWHVVPSPLFQDGRILGSSPEVVVWLQRDGSR